MIYLLFTILLVLLSQKKNIILGATPDFFGILETIFKHSSPDLVSGQVNSLRNCKF